MRQDRFSRALYWRRAGGEPDASVCKLDINRSGARGLGAIAAVIAAYAIIYPRQQLVLLVPVFIFPLFVPVSAWFFAVFWFGIQVLQGTYALFAPGMAGGIAWWAHIGGFLFGALFVTIAVRFGLGRRVPVKRWEHRDGRDAPDVGPWGRRLN